MSQLELDLMGDPMAELLGAVRYVCERARMQEVAWRLGITPAALSDALAGRKRRHIKLEHLPALVTLPGGEIIVEILARLCGREVVEAAPPTLEEEHLALTQVLSESFGPDHMRCIRASTRKRVSQNRRLSMVGADDA